MMNTDLTDVRRITFIDNASNFFPVLSPTGKRMVFDSNRLRGVDPINTSDLASSNHVQGNANARGASNTILREEVRHVIQ
jgi:Tol biopolymer transport system component